MISRRIVEAVTVSSLLSLFVAGAVAAGSGPDQPAVGTRSAPPAAMMAQATPSSVPADIKPMTLRAAEQLPPTGLASEELKWFAEQISQRTGGKVKIQFFWSESLAKATDIIPALNSGVADIGSVPSTYDPSRTADWTVVDMPNNATDYWCGIKAAFELYDTDPGLKAEFAKNGIKPLVSYASGNFHVMTKEPVKSLAELKGKRLRVYGGAQLAWLRNVGVNAIFMNYSDIYEAVQRGTVDGALATLYLTQAFKHYEVAQHMTLMQHGFVVGAPQMSINLRVWNTFPDSLKQIFREVGEAHNQKFAKDLIELEGKLIDQFKGKGMHFYTFSDQDNKVLDDAAQKAGAEWIKQMSDRGAPAQQTWDNLQKLNTQCMDEVRAHGYPWARK